MTDWLVSTLRDNVEIPLFLCLAIGYPLGKIDYRGISLGEVTATLLTALVIGQIGLTISSETKMIFFALYLSPSATAQARNLSAACFRADCNKPFCTRHLPAQPC
nr:hypothetical protein [Marinicella sp. W31]MDC2878907.1 hypothetical protein [Marinicella sp. W31]